MDSTVSVKAGPSEQQWALHRSLITQLYHIESKTLKEVMEVLENNFAFKARYVKRFNDLASYS